MGFCPNGSDFKPSAAYLYPNIGQVPPPAEVPRGWGAETNTILKTEKPLGREDPWNEEDHVTAKSHEPWTTANGTTRFVRFCMLSRFIEGKEITPGHDKKERVFCFHCLGKSFRHFVC